MGAKSGLFPGGQNPVEAFPSVHWSQVKHLAEKSNPPVLATMKGAHLCPEPDSGPAWAKRYASLLAAGGSRAKTGLQNGVECRNPSEIGPILVLYPP